MIKHWITSFLLTAFSLSAGLAQELYITQTGEATFFSSTPIENIKAKNSKVSSLFNLQTGELAVAMKIRDFKFSKPLMEEHFNENYMESDKLPKATFKGRLLDYANVDLNSGPTYNVFAEGELTIHGVTNKVKIKGSIKKTEQGAIAINTVFDIVLEDYRVERPKIVWEKIAEKVETSINLVLIKK